MTYAQALDSARKKLRAAGIEEADTDAWILLSWVSGMERGQYLLNMGSQMSAKEAEGFSAALHQRMQRIPVQLITGMAPFMGFDFAVDGNVLIPRQDTEVLAEEALKFLKKKPEAAVLDLCTGSGCLAVSLKKLAPRITCTASDLSDRALAQAEKNAKRLEANVQFIESDLFEQLPDSYDLIISNPPYIETEEIGRLAPEVKDHDPRMALDGGPDGLDFYRRICREAPDHLLPGGALFMEIGASQGEALKDLLADAGLKGIKILQDLSGRDRVAAGWK